MKPIELNLATQPYRNDSPLIVGLVLLTLAAVGFTTYNAYAFMTADTREDTLLSDLEGHRERKSQMRSESDSLEGTLREVDQETLTSQADFVTSVLRERNFSWTTLFNELEEVLPWNIRIVSVRPRFESGAVVIELIGLARDNRAYFDFQDRLLKSDHFAEIVPGNLEIQEGSKRVRFALTCNYAPPSPPAEEGSADDENASGGSEAAGTEGDTDDKPTPRERPGSSSEAKQARAVKPPYNPLHGEPNQQKPGKLSRSAGDQPNEPSFADSSAGAGEASNVESRS